MSLHYVKEKRLWVVDLLLRPMCPVQQQRFIQTKCLIEHLGCSRPGVYRPLCALFMPVTQRLHLQDLTSKSSFLNLVPHFCLNLANFAYQSSNCVGVISSRGLQAGDSLIFSYLALACSTEVFSSSLRCIIWLQSSDARSFTFSSIVMSSSCFVSVMACKMACCPKSLMDKAGEAVLVQEVLAFVAILLCV